MSELPKISKAQGAPVQLNEFHIVKVDFFRVEEDEVVPNFNLNLSKGHPEEENPTSFHLVLSLHLFFPDIRFRLNVDLMGIFHCSGVVVNEEFMNGPFVQINAPAILYPYLRAFVSSFMATAGYKTPILPAINFAATIKSNVED